MSNTGEAKSGREYEVAYAVVRVDYDMPLQEEAEQDGPAIPVGSHDITIKEVVTTARGSTNRLSAVVSVACLKVGVT